MAVDPDNRIITVRYEGGSVSGAKGLLFMLLGSISRTWNAPPVDGVQPKRKYGTIQRSRARAGRVHYVVMADGSQYTVRVTGPSEKFVDRLLQNLDSNELEKVYTQSGTKFEAQFDMVVSG